MKSNLLSWFLLVLLGFMMLLFSAWIYRSFALDLLFPSKETIVAETDLRAAYGALGDYFGGLLNPFFGFVGTCLLLLTLYYTRKDLAKTEQALEHQEKEATTSRYTNNIFQLCSVMHTRINLVEINEAAGKKVLGYQAFQHLDLLNRFADKQGNLDEDDSKNVSEFLMNANLWSFLRFALQTLEYFENLLDDDSLGKDDKIALVNIMAINIDFSFLGNHCIILKNHCKRLEDQSLNPINQNQLAEVDLILDKVLVLDKYGEQNI